MCFYTRIPAFCLFLSILHLFFLIIVLSGSPSLPAPPLLDGQGVPQEPPHHVDPHPWAANIGSAVAHLQQSYERGRKLLIIKP